MLICFLLPRKIDASVDVVANVDVTVERSVEATIRHLWDWKNGKPKSTIAFKNPPENKIIFLVAFHVLRAAEATYVITLRQRKTDHINQIITVYTYNTFTRYYV